MFKPTKCYKLMSAPHKKITVALGPVLSAGLLLMASAARTATVPENPVFPRPTIVPVPEMTAGVTQTVTAVRANWKTISNPQGEFWSDSADLSAWRDMSTGGRRGGGFGGMRGGGGASLSAYRTQLAIPADYAGHRVALRFDGVSNGAKVWVNGHFVRDHWGSFMPFTCDITDFVEPGKTASLTVSVDDSRTGLAQYVRAGGLQRDVKLIAEPMDYITRFHVDTDLDAQYRDATLKVWLRMEFHGGDDSQVKLALKDAQGRLVDLKPAVIHLSRATPEPITEVPVAAPLKWDAEHPNLYTLDVTVVGTNGSALQTLSRKFGFIKTERIGSRVLVNGREVKLRGLWGGNSVADLVADNVNHTRQKWVTEDFLDQCDQLGVYVTDENPVDFARNPVANDPQFLSQYLSFMADLVERDRDHPSVIMWGLDNESDYGRNVGPTFRYVHTEDPRRTAIFSWSHRVPDDQELPYDVFSFHYPPFNGDLASYGNSAFNDPSLVLHRQPQPQIPVLADEYAHLPIYDRDELARDPGVHSFWGESIKFYWEKIMATDGCLGGDIFGLGGGRRPPEFWLIKKAYSPVRVDNQTLSNPGPGKPLNIPITNWFDHTDLNDLKVLWAAGGESNTIFGPDIAPRAAGLLTIPARNWRDGDVVNLKFVRAGGLVVDESALPVAPALPKLPAPQGPAPKITDAADAITVAGTDFTLVFSRQTGLITRGTFQGSDIIKSGPYLHILATDKGRSTVDLPAWTLKQVSATNDGNEAVVRLSGNYGPANVDFELRIDGAGLITTKYHLAAFPFAPPEAHPRPWNDSHFGGFSEVGVSFILTNGVDRLAWRRKGLWSVYPEDHIGRIAGLAQRASAQDEFRAMKEYIWQAAALVGGTEVGLQALSDARDAVRMETVSAERGGGVSMIVNNEWNYPQLGNSNFMKPPITIGKDYSNTVRVRFARSTDAP